MARDGLVHGVVQHLCHEVVQRPLIGAADVHARPAPNRLKPFQDFNIPRGVAVLEQVSGRVSGSGTRGFVHAVFPPWFQT